MQYSGRSAPLSGNPARSSHGTANGGAWQPDAACGADGTRTRQSVARRSFPAVRSVAAPEDGLDRRAGPRPRTPWKDNPECADRGDKDEGLEGGADQPKPHDRPMGVDA